MLLAQLVQEDFIILEYDNNENSWKFISGIAAFSFVEIGINGEKSFMKPGNDVSMIHSPVPGFNPNIYKGLSIYNVLIKLGGDICQLKINCQNLQFKTIEKKKQSHFCHAFLSV